MKKLSKFLKIEFLRTAKLFFALILSIIIVNLLMYPTIASFSNVNNVFQNLAVTFLAVLMLVLNLLFLFMIISYFRRDLYHDSGYLTFSLPISSKGYLGTKLFNSAFWIILLWAATLAINYAALTYFFGTEEITTVFNYLRDNIISSPIIVIVSVIYIIISLLYSLVLLYFSIIVSKAIFRSNRVGYLWIFLYILLSYLIEYGVSFASKKLPLFLMANSSEIKWLEITDEFIMSGGILNDTNSLSVFSGISLPSIFLYTIITIVLFLISAKLLEKKIDI